MVFAIFSFAQNRQGGMFDEETVVNQPKFAGVSDALTIYNGNTANISEYIATNLKLEDIFSEGTEIIHFTVTADGKVTDFEVVNSVHPEIDSEMIRVLKTTNGMWLPGMSNGQPVEMDKEVAVTFCPSYDGEDTEAVACKFKEKATVAFNKANQKFLIDGKERQALRSYNEGIRYLPNDKALLLMRGVCQYAMGHEEDAYEDWTRLKENGGVDVIAHLVEQYHYLAGIEEFLKFASK